MQTPPDEGSARPRDLYLTTQTLHKANIHVPGGIRTHDPSKGSAADLRLRQRGFYFSLDHTQTHTTAGRTPLDEGSARRRDLYLTTQTLYKRQISMPPDGFETTIPGSAWPQKWALDRVAIGIGIISGSLVQSDTLMMMMMMMMMMTT
jgi:hypothetical protein